MTPSNPHDHRRSLHLTPRHHIRIAKVLEPVAEVKERYQPEAEPLIPGSTFVWDYIIPALLLSGFILAIYFMVEGF